MGLRFRRAIALACALVFVPLCATLATEDEAETSLTDTPATPSVYVTAPRW